MQAIDLHFYNYLNVKGVALKTHKGSALDLQAFKKA